MDQTPKQLAQSILMDKLNDAIEYAIENSDLEDLTSKQQQAVQDQLSKLGNRIAKLLNFEGEF